MTSVSPCPLATNIAAVSFLARRLDTKRRAIAGVLAYAGGRAVAYVAVGVLVAWGIAAAPQTSRFLQTVLEPFIGPLLIVVGLVLLGWIPLRLNFGPAKPGATERLADRGLPGAFLLGALFALTFCPTSAALFFGSLLPLSLTAPTQLPLYVSLRARNGGTRRHRGTGRSVRCTGWRDGSRRSATLAGTPANRERVADRGHRRVPHAVAGRLAWFRLRRPLDSRRLPRWSICVRKPDVEQRAGVICHNPARGCAGQAKWFSTFSIECRRDRFAEKTAIC